MRRDQEISRLLNGIADSACNRLAVRLPVRFLRGMPRNDRYFERALLMDQLTALLKGHHSRLSSVALHGFVGCGKSSIATEYVHRNLDLYQAVVCFDAGDRVKLERQVVQLARHLGFAAQDDDASTGRNIIMEWLSTTGMIETILTQTIRIDIYKTSNGS